MNNTTPKPRPSREDIAQMPVFEGMPLNRIHIVKSPAQIEFAKRALTDTKFIGFDTESKPTFTKGAISDGPHVIQFSTMEHAFIVQVGSTTPVELLRYVLESSVIVKVGFGLESDRPPLQRKLGIRLNASVDLALTVRQLGYRDTVGIKAAVAIVLARRLSKSRSISTSNWALSKLRPNQLLYAANDAYAALAVFNAIGKPYPSRQPAKITPLVTAILSNE